MAIVASFWLMWSTTLFLRMLREENVVSAPNAITAVLVLAIGWFILRAIRAQQRVRA